MTTRSTPERLDEAVERLLAGERPTAEAELRPLVEVAGLLAGVLRPLPAGRRFETQLGQRLAARAASRRIPLDLVTPGRLLAAGAISSAAVAVTVTALRRSSRRQAGVPHRLLQR
jgi:hypothetical protein